MTMIITPIDPARTALLLMDFQPAILAAVPDPDTLLARAQAALSWARSEKARVCYVRVAFTDEDFRAVPSHSKGFATVAQNKFLAADSPEAQIHRSLEVRDEDVVVRKTRFGAFSTTDLYLRLHAYGIETLVLAGISTRASCCPPCATLPTRTTATTSWPTPPPTPTPRSTAS
jgi:nicotinamidase-related amidase